MDAAGHYRHLLSLGRDEFLAAAAPAVLVRYRRSDPDPTATATKTLAMDEEGLGETVDEAMPHGKFSLEPTEMELYPLVKKPGASFRDRITIGRTANNDVVIAEHSVSRLHAYVRPADGWVDQRTAAGSTTRRSKRAARCRCPPVRWSGSATWCSRSTAPGICSTC
jgi:hypothetical protein